MTGSSLSPGGLEEGVVVPPNPYGLRALQRIILPRYAPGPYRAKNAGAPNETQAPATAARRYWKR